MKFSNEQYFPTKWIIPLYVVLGGGLIILLVIFQDIFQALLSGLVGILVIWILLIAWRGFFHYFFPDREDLE
jgi:hypothetical protein